ncbi:MAG: hypothetical protein K2W82_15810 [Candidatus Obscuribacterales bacterium]|jgi:N-acetylglutamate synthase-like GNAT family acetyltransferase|nr:hypothetical protein [Candidatus Obscuribacterales bacterium]
MGQKYSSADLLVTDFHTCSDRVKNEYEIWVRRLSLELDNEPGEATRQWVLENNSQVQAPYKTLIFSDKESGQIVATSSFVRDDRQITAQLKLSSSPEYLGILGFFQVRRDLRHRELGTTISRHMNSHVQQHLDSVGRAKRVYLFTNVPEAMVIFQQLGFDKQDVTVTVPELKSLETLFGKVYLPFLPSK